MDSLQKWTLVVSVIGAAAWIPQLVMLGKAWLAKPRLTIATSRVCEIGFTELGPIINIKVAISTDEKPALITSVSLAVQHESGSRFNFSWHEVSEIKGQLIVPGVESQPVIHVSEAIAVKVLPVDFKELQLRNRLDVHTEGLREFDDAFVKERRRYTNSGQYDPDKFYSSNTVQDMIDFMQSQMIWRSGKYIMHLVFNCKEGAVVDSKPLEFAIT